MRAVHRVSATFGGLLDRLRGRPGLVLGLSLGGLLLAIAITGIAGLAINRNVADITARALEHDIELEDEGDDMRAAILDLRHFHRDLFFVGPADPDAVVNFSGAYRELLEQIDDYEELEQERGLPSATELRDMAEAYYAVFSPVIDLYDTDRDAFDAASEEGLAMLQLMEEHSRDIERLGEAQSESSLANVDRANRQARMILVGVLAGVVLIGVGLVWSAVRVVTQIRGLYEAQQAAAMRLADAVRAKTDFIADASHELRTPLTVLRGNAEAGLAIERNCVHAEILEDIVAESARMTRLVEDLLFLARSDAESIPLRMESVPAEAFAMTLADRARMLVSEHSHELTTALGGNGTLRVDAQRIEQAVMILLDNAAKFSPPNGRISLNTWDWKQEFTFEVVDRGPGMPEEEVAHIFERFYRVDKVRNRRQGGAGLGLSIAKTIIDAHGGRIEVESDVGKGTKIRLVVPLARKDASASVARRQQPTAITPVATTDSV